MDDELKPCPFCGRNAGIGERSYKTSRKSGVQHGFTANCMNPDCLAVVAGIEAFDTKAEATAAWNTRAAINIADDELVERVARAIADAGTGVIWRDVLESNCCEPDMGDMRNLARAAITATSEGDGE